MKIKSTLALSAILACGLAAPAFADWNSIGSVDVGRGMDRDSAYTDFAGGIDRLQFAALNGDVQCSAVRAQFANGRTQTIFQGVIRAGDARTVDLPGDQAHVRRLDFTCRGDNIRQTRVDIRADISTPSYRDEWRHSPFWSRWSAVFHWAPPSAPAFDQNWRAIGVQTFAYRNQRDANVVGFSGQNVTSLGLRPDADARCPRVWVTFGNGQRANLGDGARLLSSGRMARFDLPGSYRNITNVQMTCRAVNDRDVRIQVFARG